MNIRGEGRGISQTAVRLIGAVLYQVRPTDPIAFGGASAVLLLGALTASYVPARRAMAVEPATALRCE